MCDNAAYPADSLVDSVDGSALRRFQVVRVRARRITAFFFFARGFARKTTKKKIYQVHVDKLYVYQYIKKKSYILTRKIYYI